MAKKAPGKPFTIRKSRTGLGLFAAQGFKRGKFVVEYTGKKVLTARNGKRPAKIQRYQFEINSKWTLDGYTKKNIAPGEELTLDYGEEYFEEFIRPLGCKCVVCDAGGAKEAAAPG